MARKKIKHESFANESKRNTTYKNRLEGLSDKGEKPDSVVEVTLRPRDRDERSDDIAYHRQKIASDDIQRCCCRCLKRIRRVEGNLFVTLFGDGSSARCEPAQLIPFVQNFNRPSKGETTTVFIKAVNEAMKEAARVLDSGKMCACIFTERRALMTRPEAGVARLELPKYEAIDVLSRLTSYAKRGLFASTLEVGVVRGGLSSFYLFKGVDRSQVYREPCTIEGLEDKGSSDKGEKPVNDESVVEVALRPRECEDGSDDIGSFVHAGFIHVAIMVVPPSHAAY